MLSTLFQIQHVRISNAPRLYPRGIEWAVKPGLNVVVGGTGLGKTTFVNAMLFGLLGSLGRSSKRGVEKVDAEYFRGRTGVNEEDEAPNVEVEALCGKARVVVKRDLATGRLLKATVNEENVPANAYEATIATSLGLENFDSELLQIVDHLIYIGESPNFLTWDSHTQNEILSTLFGSSEMFQQLTSAWDAVQSNDSEFRNIRFQAGRIERQIQELSQTATKDSPDVIATQRLKLTAAREQALANRDDTIARWQLARDTVENCQRHVNDLGLEYSTLAQVLAEIDPYRADHAIQHQAFSNPRTAALVDSIRGLVASPQSVRCVCCSQIPKRATDEVSRTAELLRKNRCPICGTGLARAGGGPASVGDEAKIAEFEMAIDAIATKLRKAVLEEEQARSRLRVLEDDKTRLEEALSQTRDDEWKFQLEHPLAGGDQRLIALESLRRDQRKAESARRRSIAAFEAVRTTFNSTLRALRKDIAKEFRRYCGLFLDESCEIEFDEAGAHAERPGPQIDPLHSAFYPIVDGQVRYRPESLSEAQRAFVDLAFRMALIDVWHRRTKSPATLVVETPEGTVDGAYMIRVAQMLRQFAAEGHSLIVTTNLNSNSFLSELFRKTPKRERKQRILNLLELGVPKPVQRRHKRIFAEIIQNAISGER